MDKKNFVESGYDEYGQYYETYKDKDGYITEFFSSDDDIPEGCAACGGDYPNCKDSCPLYG